ncbi:MAG: serine hydrolase [Planctomycetes bacterium]|nr:serine hydrolase [Planctomycetota bacterium]
MNSGALHGFLFLAACGLLCNPGIAQIERAPVAADSDRDGLPNSSDSCPQVSYQPGFSGSSCAPMDLNPNNDSDPECKARERVANLLLNNGMFTTRIAFAVIENGKLHFADAFEYTGGGQFRNDPDGILHLDDFVSDEDGSQITSNGQRTLRQLLRHQGAFKLDAGALHLFCYPGDLPSFWAENNDLISPHYDSPTYGNLGGGYQYSAFNYSLAGTYLQNQAGLPFAELVQRYLFDYAGMCTASFDGSRAVTTSIGKIPGVSQSAVMHVGPTINLVSQSDPLCEDNYYSSNALPVGSSLQ